MAPQQLETTGMKHIDAELLTFGSAPMIGERLTGYISKDKKNRFDEGSVVTTSVVKEISITSEGTFVTTSNSVYKLV
jgi:hypothetical protein